MPSLYYNVSNNSLLLGSVLDFGILVEDDLMRSPIPSTDLDIEVVNTLTYNSVVVGSNIKINGSLGIIDGTTDVANNYELRDPLNDTSNLSDANVGEITRATITLTPSTTPGFSVSDKTFDATTGVPSSLVTGDINLVNNYGTSLSLAAAELTSYRFTHPDENVGSDKDLFIVLETTSNYTTLYTDPDRSSVSSLNSNVVPRELRAIYRNPGSGRTFDKYYDTTTVVNSTEEGSHDFYSLVDSTDASINRFPFSNFAPIVDTTTDISYNFEDANVGTNKNISLSGLILDANESVNNNYSLNLTSYSTTGDISATPLTVDLSKYELLDKNYDGTTAVNSQDPDNVTEPGYYTLKDPNNRIVFDSRNPTPNFLSTEITYTYPQKDVLFTSNTVRAMSIVGTTPALNPSQSNNYSIAPVSGLTKSAKINPVNFSITGYNISKGWDNLTYIRGSNSTLTFEFTTVDNILATNEIASGELVLPVKNDFTTISTTSKNVGNTTISSTTKLDIKKADGSTNYNYIVGTETLPGKVAMQGRDVTIEVAELVLTASSSNEMYYRKNFDGTTNKGTSTSLTNDVISTTSIGSFFNVTSTNSSLTSINITLADYTTSSPNVNTSGNELVALNSISVTLPTTHQNNVSIEYKDNSDNAADLKDLIYAKITPIAAYINFTPDLAFEDYTQREETRGTRVTTPFNISSGSIIFENAAGNELPLIGDVTYELFPNSDRPGTRSVYIRNVSFANATDNANMSVQYQGTYAGFRTSAGTPSVVIIKNEITYRAATNFTATKVFDNTTTVSYTGDLEQVDSYGQVINIPVNSVTLRYEDVNVGTDKTLIFASTPTISSTNIYYYDINTTLNANMIGNITPLDVTVTGHNFIKEYDGNTTFNSTITGSTVSAERDIGELNNALAKTLFNISISNLEFPQSNIGTDLTLSGNYTLTAVSGTDISNINFTDPLAAGSITGNIIPTTLTISRNSLSIGNKEYDGTTAINNDLITGTIRIINSINADVTVDDVVDSLTFVFASSNVASNIATTPTLTLVTAYDNTNYTISHNSTNSIENITANIVPKKIYVTAGDPIIGGLEDLDRTYVANSNQLYRYNALDVPLGYKGLPVFQNEDETEIATGDLPSFIQTALTSIGEVGGFNLTYVGATIGTHEINHNLANLQSLAPQTERTSYQIIDTRWKNFGTTDNLSGTISRGVLKLSIVNVTPTSLSKEYDGTSSVNITTTNGDADYKLVDPQFPNEDITISTYYGGADDIEFIYSDDDTAVSPVGGVINVANDLKILPTDSITDNATNSNYDYSLSVATMTLLNLPGNNITPKSLTIEADSWSFAKLSDLIDTSATTAISSTDATYDTGDLVGLVSGETLTLDATGDYASVTLSDPDVPVEDVNINNLLFIISDGTHSTTGSLASNYTLTQPIDLTGVTGTLIIKHEWDFSVGRTVFHPPNDPYESIAISRAHNGIVTVDINKVIKERVGSSGNLRLYRMFFTMWRGGQEERDYCSASPGYRASDFEATTATANCYNLDLPGSSRTYRVEVTYTFGSQVYIEENGSQYSIRKIVSVKFKTIYAISSDASGVSSLAFHGFSNANASSY